MKGKVMTWDEFRKMCEEDAYIWSCSGYKADELAPADILNEYDESFFSDDENTEYDDLSSFFTPDDFVIRTLEYLTKI